MNYREAWANGEIEAGTLVDAIEDQAREIERLNYRYQREVYGLNNEGDPIGGDPAGGYANDNARLRKELAALKAQPVGVVLPDRASDEITDPAGYDEGWNACLDEVSSLNPAPSHGERVREGWQLVPVEPTDAMLEAGDKYIGTPATYKSMLSACPSPAITKDFSQFLSAVMDAAGLIRHGRQSKELSEYLGMKCMEYRGAALSAPSHGEQVRDGWKLVPERMHLSREAIESITAHCGDGQEDAGYGPYSDGVLWVGEIEEEDGAKTYGLHIATTDYPEEGSTTLVEFAAPSAASQKGGE